MHVTRVSSFRPLRLVGGTSRQRRRSLVCPAEPGLEGKRAVVTGGNAGIGYETCRGLLERGAEVVMASRNEERSRAACARLREELGGDAPVRPVTLDLGDLDSVARATDQMGEHEVDLLVANAGVWPRAHATSAQGHELAFAVNVLGHFVLVSRLFDRLAPSARVVMLTGDIYCLASSSTPDFAYRGILGGMAAYCRSKLGNLWLVSELTRRHPELTTVAVHPGVVATGLAGRGAPPAGSRPRRGPEVDATTGAQTSLYCSTQPDIRPGGYYHNVYGRMVLPPSDPALAEDGARALWDTCERLAAPWLGGEALG